MFINRYTQKDTSIPPRRYPRRTVLIPPRAAEEDKPHRLAGQTIAVLIFLLLLAIAIGLLGIFL